MNLTEAKAVVERVEPLLAAHPFVLAHVFERNGRRLELLITERLRRACKRGRVWKSKGFLTALKNASYGFDPLRARSAGGADGLFLLTREHRSRNAMMRKVFERYLDRPDSGVRELTRALEVDAEDLLAVRLVSHHLRLLGVLVHGEVVDQLVLIDYDDSE